MRDEYPNRSFINNAAARLATEWKIVIIQAPASVELLLPGIFSDRVCQRRERESRPDGTLFSGSTNSERQPRGVCRAIAQDRHRPRRARSALRLWFDPGRRRSR